MMHAWNNIVLGKGVEINFYDPIKYSIRKYATTDDVASTGFVQADCIALHTSPRIQTFSRLTTNKGRILYLISACVVSSNDKTTT